MPSSDILDVSLVYNKENQFGLKQDAALIQETLASYGPVRVRHADPLEPPVPCDIAIHLEVPIYVYMPWAAVNIWVINPEWLEEDAWKPYATHFDALVFKEAAAADRFKARNPVLAPKVVVIPWALPKSALLKKNSRLPLTRVMDSYGFWRGAEISVRQRQRSYLCGKSRGHRFGSWHVNLFFWERGFN